ncbi:MAG: DUF938 domain-containing protein [Acidimicrobiales bacterium]|nr:DUF938 domain-containing protein [Hyphomonadaceae bacterium]RZV44908.1 MAG: DUF938 domain-containing protein [Acidimicrobiales bacterium]
MKYPIHLENRDLIGKRLVSPTSERNRTPIGEHLAKLLPQNAQVLEIAAGTGQHAHHMCGLRTDICWQPTDIDPDSLLSQAAYAQDFPERILDPVELNVTHPEWWSGFENSTTLFCANMIHIAPWNAAQGLARGAGHLLRQGGKMFLYGPFLLETDNADSNLEFDSNLKARNPEWGVRSLDAVKHIFADQGLNLEAIIEMPRNNLLLKFATSS